MKIRLISLLKILSYYSFNTIMDIFLPLILSKQILYAASFILLLGSFLILYRNRFMGAITFIVAFFFLFSWYVISFTEMLLFEVIMFLYIGYLLGAFVWLQPIIHKIVINIEFYFLAFRYKLRKL